MKFLLVDEDALMVPSGLLLLEYESEWKLWIIDGTSWILSTIEHSKDGSSSWLMMMLLWLLAASVLFLLENITDTGILEGVVIAND